MPLLRPFLSLVRRIRARQKYRAAAAAVADALVFERTDSVRHGALSTAEQTRLRRLADETGDARFVQVLELSRDANAAARRLIQAAEARMNPCDFVDYWARLDQSMEPRAFALDSHAPLATGL